MYKMKHLSVNNKLNTALVYLLFSMTFVLFCLYCFKMIPDADTLFPLRYINALLAETPSLIVVQPGSRVFPEWLYAWIARLMTSKVEIWSDLVLFLNGAMLTFCLWYFIKQLALFNFNQVTLLTSSILVVIPVLSLLNNNYLHYYIFMHGTHAFLLPFVFLYFGFLLKYLRTNKVSRFNAFFLVFGLSVLVASNLLTVLVIIGPLLTVLLWLHVTGINKNQAVFKSILFLVVSILLGFLWGYCFEYFFPHIILMKNSYPLLEQGWAQWFTDNRMFRHLLDRSRSGYISAIMIVAVIAALLSLVFYRKEPHKPFYLLMLFYVVSFVSFFLVTWVTNKNHIRYMPHLMFLSPLVIVLALRQLKLINSFTPISIVLLLLFSITFYKNESSLGEMKRFKVGLSEIGHELASLKKQFNLHGDGLSDYWFSHAFNDDSLNILPMSKGLRTDHIKPVTWAIDLNSYWHFDGSEADRRQFNFVVNYKFSDKSKWIIKESVVLQSFGSYDEVVKFSKGIYDYQIYVYTKGVSTERFYHHLEQYLLTNSRLN